MMLRALPRAAAGIAASLALQQTCQQSDDRLARWRKRWEGDTRGWELGKTVHPRLAEFEERLLPDKSARVLVPLAGQSHDVAHLAWRGHNVVAVEGVPAALDAFKEAYGADEARRIAGHACDDYDGPDVASALATMHVVRLPAPEGGSKRLTWHTGDFLGNFSCPLVDAAWDRGGLVAVAPDDREAYAAVLKRLVRPGGRVLFVSVEHPPFEGGKLGPPHSIERAEVDRLFSADFDIEVLKREDRMPVEPWRERGCDYFWETTYLLTRKDAPFCDAAGRLMSLS